MKPRKLFGTNKACATRTVPAAMLLILAALSSPACAIPFGEPDGDRHPSVGAVIVYHPLYGVIPYFSGTLVHERVFLTAGHGVASILAGEVELLGVSFDPAVDLVHGTWVPVEKMFYDDSDLEGANPNRADIGLFILEKAAKSITPATLPSMGFLDDLKNAGQLVAGPEGTEFTVVGYGWGLDWPPPEPVYPISPDGIALRNMALTGYQGLNESWLIATQNPAEGYGGVANGDSGGPALWTDPATGEEILVAITAWGGSPVGNSFYYRVDTARSLQFIQDGIDAFKAK